MTKVFRLFICIFVASFVLSSCATRTKIEYRDVIVDRYNTIEVHDTLRENTHDSVYVEIRQKGDTVYNTKYVERTKWRDRIVERHDTCWRDSVVTEYKETTVEKTKIPKLFWASLVFSVIVIIFAFIKLIRWLQIQLG